MSVVPVSSPSFTHANDHVAGSHVNRDDLPPFLTIYEAAEYFGKSDKTIRRWIKNGTLRSNQFSGPNGHHMIPASEIRRLSEPTGSDPADADRGSVTPARRTGRRSMREIAANAA